MKRAALAVGTVITALMFTGTTALASFSDVPTNAWYAKDVETVQSLGIMQGRDKNTFDPNGTLSYAEGISIAAQIHAIKHNQQIPTSDGIWYEGAVNYARTNGILPDDFDHYMGARAAPHGQTSYDLPIPRYEIAYYFAHVLPDGECIPINKVELTYDFNSPEVLKLYQAGILRGTGEYGAFFPETSITRAETAAIVNRIVNPENRMQFTLKTLEVPTGLSPLPDGSNVDEVGTVYPKEGDIINGVKVTRDPASGVLGLGNGGKGGIYLGITYPSNGVTIKVGSTASSFGYDNMGGYYEQKGDYIFWHDEWNKIQGAAHPKVMAEHPTAKDGTCADIYGNVTNGTLKDKNTFFYYDAAGKQGWVWLGNAPKFN